VVRPYQRCPPPISLASFDVLVTGDKRLQFQQNIAAARSHVVVSREAPESPTSFATARSAHSPIREAKPGTVTQVARSNTRLQPTQPAPTFSRVRYHFARGLRG